GQSLPWGFCFTSASKGRELHPHRNEVVTVPCTVPLILGLRSRLQRTNRTLPRDVGRQAVMEQYRPLFHRDCHSAGTRLARLFALLIDRLSAVDVGSGVHGVVQDAIDGRRAGQTPDKGCRLSAVVRPQRQTNLVLPQVAADSTAATQLEELVED